MSNLALYRKYRSADFSEVVGQKHVVSTLTNAIATGKHSHAYLLTGPRGVGKTSIARIIAKQLNGLNKEDSISSHLDIIEIDGASNRGIDEIRSLREKVQVLPAKLEYKVYIIDEVHMLTTPAFNALLKTLEEPPAHVVFIFATTEAHKLPETITSRTQRFDFKPILASDMTKHLRYIADQENIIIEDKALDLIAKISRGGFRDAISLLDQVSAIKGPITVSIISDFTGLQDSTKIKQIFDARDANQIKEMLSFLQALYDSGADTSLLAQQMLDSIQSYLQQGDVYSDEFLLGLAENLHWVQSNIRQSSLPQLVLQVGLAKSFINSQANSTQPTMPMALASAQVNSHKEVGNIEGASTAGAPKSKTLEPETKLRPDSEELFIKSLSVIKHYNNSLYAVLKGAEIRVYKDSIEVVCRFSFHKDRIAEPRNTSLVEKAFTKVYGRSMHLIIKLEAIKKPTQIDSQEELVSSAMAILGGEVIDG
ncbi:MAG: DNA polymerase III subunit gamma/tau [Patescibacteria group bacterium]|nr:DNA polymerase III subunit gamma/tau [Patescibacteria group bacterium]